MLHLDVKILSEAIHRVGNWLKSANRDLDSPGAAILIALVYERLVRGQIPGSFSDVISNRTKGPHSKY